MRRLSRMRFREYASRRTASTSDEDARLQRLLYDEHYRVADPNPDVERERMFCAKMELHWIKEWAKKSFDEADKRQAAVRRAVLERIDLHKPLSYVLGSQLFLSCEITCRPPVLIPRPETEEWTRWLVHQCVPHGDESPEDPLVLLDLCCGTGCVGLAFAKQFSNASVVASDVDETAVQLARENAAHLSVADRYSVVQSDMFEALPRSLQRSVDIVVCNPPYILPDQMNEMPKGIANWETRLALVGIHEKYPPPLGYYKAIATQSKRLLRPRPPDRRRPSLVVEVGLQAEAVAQLFDQSADWTDVSLHVDRWRQPRWISANVKT